MAELRKCGRCRSEIELKYFDVNRKGTHNKTCTTCLSKKKRTKPLSKNPTDVTTRTDIDITDDNISTTTPDTSETHEQEPPKMAYKLSIPIDATDVATLLGLNKYQTNLHELVMKYWKRGDPVDFLDTKSKLKQEGIEFANTKTSDEKIMEVCEEKGISVEFNSLADMDTLLDLLDDEEELDVEDEDITSFCNKQMGVQFEKSAIQMYEERYNVKVDAMSNYVKKIFKEDGLYKWSVGGRVDGVIGFDKIVEIKNRKKGFYPSIPLSEILQVYTYMFAMSIHQASLVEKFENDIKETVFIYTSGYETYALTKLTKFCNFMEEFISNAVLKEQFMKCGVDDTDQLESINNVLLEKLDIKHMRTAKVTPIKDIITKSEPPIMVFDIEHTGCTEVFILQLSWGLYKRDGTLIEMKDYFLKPNNIMYIHPRAIEKHKITYEALLQKPNTLEISELLTKFTADALRCQTLVAHNMKSDLNTLNKELLRNSMNEINVNTYCTMEQTKRFCNSKDKRNRVKNPRLDELHQKLFNSPIDSTMAHNSCYDVEICAKCYFQCKDMKI